MPTTVVAGAAPVADVLVVDDDADINRLVVLRLNARGYTVRSAGNGREALDEVETATPDLIFLDVSMPEVSGLEVLERVRAQGLDLSVIMMTAFGSEGVAIEALRRGADDYLCKPFQRQDFEATLQRTVERLRLRRENAALLFQLDEKRRQLEAELAHAARVQMNLLPHTAPALPGLDIAARCVPAREVGGDFYDWQTRDDGSVTITLGDVMGKGMPAALLAATVRAALRAVHEPTPAGQVQRAAVALEGDLLASDSFVTLFHARVDPAGRSVQFVDAGHGHVFVRRAGGAIEQLEPRTLPLGVLEGVRYPEGALSLTAGDALVIYSDGLIDAFPGTAPSLGRLGRALDGTASASEMVARLVELPGLTGPPPDDLTVAVVMCTDAR